MRASQAFLTTLREVPHDAEIVSHQLMLRAGLIRKLGAGLYTWLPLGLRVLHKVETIVREEMNAIHAQEVLMPAVQPAELWQETGRWETFGSLLLKMTDSQSRAYCFGPTHEEVITDLVRQELRSYKQLPVTLYQIQTKFRDEIRPRFGVMRAREFIMKDAYSFHLTQGSLENTYDDMYNAYGRIFDRLGLTYRAVEADTGAIGGAVSHEFQVLAEAGEDTIFYSNTGTYAANVEQATNKSPLAAVADLSTPALSKVPTPNLMAIDAVANALGVEAHALLKTLIVEGAETPLVALVLSGDDALNEVKAAKHPLVKSPLTMAKPETVLSVLGAPLGFLGPIGLSIPVIADHHALAKNHFICGANEADMHLQHVVWGRDAHYDEAYDLRTVREGDESPDGNGLLRACRGIEVGHVFQLGDKYAQSMGLTVLDETGQSKTLLMGCYGLGVSRVIAAAIEQHHDEKGIIWPASMAPFDCVIIPVNANRSPATLEAAVTLYNALREKGVDVLLDDRDERPGVLFKDCDLWGIPHRIVVSEKHLASDVVEYKARTADAPELIQQDIATILSKF